MTWRLNLVMSSVLLVYILVGALIFHVIEYDKSTPADITSMTFFQQFLANNPNVSAADLTAFASSVVTSHKDGGVVGNATEKDNGWTYDSATFFCVTIITTVGYGNISPSTTGGKIFCLFYTLVGIPIMATLLASIGSTLHKPIEALHRTKPWYPKSKFKDKLIKSGVVLLVGTLLMLCVPAVIFIFSEDWDYTTAIYYSTITLTTVGFGDYVAGQKEERYRALYRILMCFWLVFGLSWLALCFSAVSNFYSGSTADKVLYSDQGDNDDQWTVDNWSEGKMEKSGKDDVIQRKQDFKL